MKSIRVLVADDSALMRQTLRRIIDAAPGLELVGVARDGEDAVTKARELRPMSSPWISTCPDWMAFQPCRSL